MSMEFFHSSKSREKPNGVLTHFGSMLVAAQRVESIFTTSEWRAFNGGDEIAVVDYHGRVQRMETFNDTMNTFIDFAQGAIISKFDIPVFNPLRLYDCWDDDPIGSGGLDIFKDNTQITPQQREDLKTLFAPFTGVVYPEHVYAQLTPDYIRKIIRDGQTNGIFKREFEKRKVRSLSMGEDFRKAAAQEAVWVDLTLKLRNWAIANKFDAFLYSSAHEADGAECCVTLSHAQVPDASETYKFDRQKYLDTAAPVFKDFFKAHCSKDNQTSIGHSLWHDAYWCGFNPTIFWLLPKNTPSRTMTSRV